MNHNIKFIYFDVGGVTILDFSKNNKWQEMAQDLGIKESNIKRFYEIFDEFGPKVCVGKKYIDDFAKTVSSKFKLNLPEDYSMLDDFVNRFEPNPSLRPLLNKLAKQYQQ